MSPTQTHWSRILFHDLYAPPARAEALRAPLRQKENALTTRHPQHHDPALGRSPLGSAVILLGIYVVMYLAVAGIVHALSPSEATTGAPDTQTAAAALPSMPAAAGATGANDASTD